MTAVIAIRARRIVAFEQHPQLVKTLRATRSSITRSKNGPRKMSSRSLRGDGTGSAPAQGIHDIRWHAIRFYRLARRLHRAGHPRAARVASAFNQLISGAEIQPGADLGDQPELVHPNGIVVHGSVTAGHRLAIYHRVTLGDKRAGQFDKGPQLGNDVTIYAGTKVIGDVQIGDEAVIGANAVVTRDVPAGSVVAGNPARVIR